MKISRHALRRFVAGATFAAFLFGTLQPLPFPPSAACAFTVGEEREVGEKLLSIVRKEFNLIDDPDITEYVTLLGRQTLQLAGSQFFDYHFFVIDNKEFNAFAAPSGLIFFHSGLVDICTSEGELVSVLAHEIGHAASRHIADRISKSGKVNAGTTALMLAGLLLGGGALSQALITGSMAGGAMANLKFSRQDEEEADRLAYKWMKEQERDPQEMVNMLKKMRRVSRYHRNRVPTYLLTHPEPENRIGYIEDKILQDPRKSFPGHEEFAFQRFRYRVQTLSKDTQSILPILKNKAAEPDTLANDPMIFYALSQAYLLNRDFRKAEDALAKVISRFPDKLILKTDLGRLKLESGETEEALQIFQAVNKDAPYSIYNTFYLAKALQQAGQQAQAVQIYETLTDQLPAYPKLYYEIGRIRAALGNQALGHYNLGIYHFYQGAAPTARFHFDQALKGLPYSDPLYEKIMVMKEKMERLEKM
ncbi:beta-barrel assembly-enhancing protease [Thiovibrio sp. JS02]